MEKSTPETISQFCIELQLLLLWVLLLCVQCNGTFSCIVNPTGVSKTQLGFSGDCANVYFSNPRQMSIGIEIHTINKFEVFFWWFLLSMNEVDIKY
jgi:hypothetical protein